MTTRRSELVAREREAVEQARGRVVAACVVHGLWAPTTDAERDAAELLTAEGHLARRPGGYYELR